jgi:hypothetical protein
VTAEIVKLYLLGLPALLAGLWLGFNRRTGMAIHPSRRGLKAAGLAHPRAAK